MNNKLSYTDPADALIGKPCRGCDIPGTPEKPVVLQGYAPDGRPLYGHQGCQSLIGSENKTTALPLAVAGNLGLIPGYKEEQEDIWAFASVNSMDPQPGEVESALEKTPEVDNAVTTDAASQYAGNGTGASVPPSH